jgi:hypothetical protein
LFRAEHRRGGREKARGLSESADGGGVSAWSVRRDDAQDKAKHGRFLLLRFLDELVKNP